MENIVLLALSFAVFWAVICRVNHMKTGVTRPAVFIQHALLGMGAVGVILFPAPFDKISILLGVLVFLAVGSVRWKDGAPPGINKPPSFDVSRLSHVAGGKKSTH